jgi:hypothetical protein
VGFFEKWRGAPRGQSLTTCAKKLWPFCLLEMTQTLLPWTHGQSPQAPAAEDPSKVPEVAAQKSVPKQKIFRASLRHSQLPKEREERGEHFPGRRQRFGDAIRTTRQAGLRGSDGLTCTRPRRLPGRPTEWSALRPLARGHSAGWCRPTPSGGSPRQLLAPKVLAQTWRKWQAGVTP